MRLLSLRSIFATFLLSANAYPCEMTNPVRHTNPDGSLGGLIDARARVAAGAFIAPTARVCGTAWVDGDAMILDGAVVKDQAWIGVHSVIKDRAVVSGRAHTEGSVVYKATVGGNAQVYGNARVFHGATVLGSAKVYGSVTLEGTQVSGSAVICEGQVIRRQEVTDDYFCSDAYDSRADLEFETYAANKVNVKRDQVRLRSKNYNLSRDNSLFTVRLNGEIVDPSKVFVQGDSLGLNLSGLQTEGWNTFEIYGQDEHGKKISIPGEQFFVGSGIKAVNLQNNSGQVDNSISPTVTYHSRGVTLTGEARVQNGILELRGVAPGLELFEVEVSGVGSRQFIYEKFDSFEELPASLNTTPLPDFVNNNTDFSDNLVSWQMSHPGNVSIINENGKNVLQVEALETDRVEISKRLRLNTSQVGVALEVALPQVAKIIIDTNSQVEVFLISIGGKKIVRYGYNLNSDISLERNLSIASNGGGGDVVVFVRLSASLALSRGLSLLRLRSLAAKNVVTEFTPYHFNVINGRGINLPTSLGDAACSNTMLETNGNGLLGVKYDKDFNLFSAGSVNEMLEISENRIFAKLLVRGRRKSNITGVKLLGIQNDNIVFEQGLSLCALKKFNNLREDEFVYFPETTRLSDALFAIPFTTLAASVNSSPGKKLVLMVQVDIQGAKGIETSISNEVPVDLLVTPLIGRLNWYSFVDSYDSNIEGVLRTGGDKWIDPAYVEAAQNISYLFSSWRVNDFSKLNGGVFPGHETHRGGVDVDLRYYYNQDNFLNLSRLNGSTAEATHTNWKNGLEKVDTLLAGITHHYSKIDFIYITREQANSTKRNIWGGAYERDYIMNKFNNRCFGTNQKRYIDLLENSSVGRSLLRHSLDHYDHIHLRFNLNNAITGGPGIIEPTPPGSSIDELKFKFEADGRLKIEPIDPSLFKGHKILWRLQSEEGYNNLTMQTDMGVWDGGPLKTVQDERSLILKTSLNQMKYLYVTIASKVNGGCSETLIPIDFSKRSFDSLQEFVPLSIFHSRDFRR